MLITTVVISFMIKLDHNVHDDLDDYQLVNDDDLMFVLAKIPVD